MGCLKIRIVDPSEKDNFEHLIHWNAQRIGVMKTKVTACVSSLTSDPSSMQCSPACSDMMTAVQASACYTGLSFSSSIPAEMWSTLEQACQLFDTCYEEQMTYQQI